jgi:hypothetical protein
VSRDRIAERTHTGWVWCPEAEKAGHQRGGYFEDTATLREWLAAHGEPVPPHVVACEEIHLHIEPEWALESALDEADEDARDRVDGAAWKAFVAACERFNADSGVTWWAPTSVYLVMEQPRRAKP